MRACVARDIRFVFDSPDLPRAEARLNEIVEKHQKTAPKLATWLEGNLIEELTVFKLSEHFRRRLRTFNMCERINREIKRRTRVAGPFPYDSSSYASSPTSSWKPPTSRKPDAPNSPTHPNPKQPTKPDLQIQPLTLLQKKSCAAHLEGILAHWTQGLTTAFMKGIDRLFSAVKRKARGYRSVEYMTTMLYFVAGNSHYRVTEPLKVARNLLVRLS